MNGRQLAEEARQRRPALKVLFMTGYSRNAIVHQGRLDAGVELIQKPLDSAHLATTVRRISTLSSYGLLDCIVLAIELISDGCADEIGAV
jgi:CheY-like chemotaxis protein